MKKLSSQIIKWIRGQSTAVLISIALHLLIAVLASVFVVFNIVKKPEKKFEPPPPVERPKMKLKKPRVKMKKQTQPKRIWPIKLLYIIPFMTCCFEIFFHFSSGSFFKGILP